MGRGRRGKRGSWIFFLLLLGVNPGLVYCTCFYSSVLEMGTMTTLVDAAFSYPIYSSLFFGPFLHSQTQADPPSLPPHSSLPPTPLLSPFSLSFFNPLSLSLSLCLLSLPCPLPPTQAEEEEEEEEEEEKEEGKEVWK